MLYNFFENVLMLMFQSFAVEDVTEQGYILVEQPRVNLTVGQSFLITAGVYAAVFLLFYVFLSIGLFTMAKRRDMKSAFLAFIPIANLYLMGQLSGEVNIFGLKIKKLGLVAVIVAVVAFGIFIGVDSLYVKCLVDNWDGVFNRASFDAVYSETYIPFGAGVPISLQIFQIIVCRLGYTLVWLLLLVCLFKNYAPRSCLLFSLLSAFIPIVAPILVFAIRKNSSDEYRKYMQMKMHSMYGGGNPYQFGDGSYYDPYDLSAEGKKGAEKPESPFEEYEDKK